MNVGIVSTWFERGAAYVSKMYLNALKEKGNNVYIYARGGEKYERNSKEWNQPYVTWGLNLRETNINEKHLEKWIKKNSLNVIFFNEQREFSIVAKMKKKYPAIKFGAYIDYYTEEMLPYYDIYDFIICNTHRHYEAFQNNKVDKYYIKWGTDIDLYKPNENNEKDNSEITFFHSMGMSSRKGTELLISAFIEGKLYEKSKLIIHTQKDLESTYNLRESELGKYNIEVINKTIGAPGLYYKGDVYVYPTKLEGLGLTLYEAMSSGLPVITTNFPPMNEIINEENGKLIDVKQLHSRSDGYYWPLAICEKDDIIKQMKFYIDNKEKIREYKENAREYAIKNLNFKDRYDEINKIFENVKSNPINMNLYNKIIKNRKRDRKKHLLLALSNNSYLENVLYNIINKK